MRPILIALVFSLLSITARANEIVVEQVEGQVFVQSPSEASTPARLGQKLSQGVTVRTSSNARTVLRFSDGQAVALDKNSSFVVRTYRYEEKTPKADSIIVELTRGAARLITGFLGKRNPDAFKLTSGTLTAGVRGTEFMLSVVNNVSYVQTLSGTVQLTTVTGQTITLAAGQTVAISAAGAVISTGAAAASMASQAGAFSGLNSMSLTVGAGTAGSAGTASSAAGGAATGGAAGSATAAASAATGALTTAGIAGATAVAAGAAIAAGSSKTGSSTSTSTSTQ